MANLTRRRILQAGVTTGALAIWPATSLARSSGSAARPPTGPAYSPAAVLTSRHHPHGPVFPEGTTLTSTLHRVPGPGYRRLRRGPGDAARGRHELAAPRPGREDRRDGVATVVQVSDLHVTDVQNPMRFEYLDRINGIGHRAQEFLGVHGAVALVDRINALAGGPWTGRAVDVVVSTGDNTDNQAHIELEWLLGVLAGGTVHPDSGTPDGYEGVAASGIREYWQPQSHRPDDYKDRGFPCVPGLLDAATRPLSAPGLAFPWVLTMGNHDDMANGMLRNRQYVEDWATGGRKILSARTDRAYQLAGMLKGAPANTDARELLSVVARAADTRTVHADPRRLPYSGSDFVAALREPQYAGAGPDGHGYGPDADPDRLYFRYDASDRLSVISLDTTNRAGGAAGSIGRAQLAWLEQQLDATRDRYVIVLSHHPSRSMTNVAPDPRAPLDPRYGAAPLVRTLHRHPQVLAWLNGHLHRNKITPHRHIDPHRSFWEINTASHVDPPQQARVVEVARNGDGTVSLFTTMIDADAPVLPDPGDLSTAGLAAYYRELAFNDNRIEDRGGSSRDRNTELLLADPLPA